MHVQNRRCIRRLSFKALMAARRRNRVAVIAIALTALLFTSLFTVVLSINATNQNYQFRSVGSYAHGAFKDVGAAQAAALSAHPRVKASGRRTVIGLCAGGAFAKDFGEVSFMDARTAEWCYALPTAGRMPQGEKEVAMDTDALALLGVTPEPGARVTLTYTLTDKEQTGETVTDTFTLVGWWDYDPLMGVHYVNISQPYAQKMEAEALTQGMAPFRTDLSVMLSTSLGIEEALTQIAADCGYTAGDGAGQLRIGVNWGYTATQIADTLDAGGILAVVAVLALVAFTGYLVIYNIFQISVAGDIRFYGLLKTIGVTPRQLKRIIRQQALLLSAAGIPIGLLLGYAVGAAAVPVALAGSTIGGRYTTVSLSPWIFLGAALFALATVLLSCARPGRIAGSVSAIEAVRYTEAAQTKKKRRAGVRVTPFSMARANLGRSRGKTALVVVSLSLAVVLLNLLATFIAGFDLEKYLSHRSSADFLVSTADYFSYHGSTLAEADVAPVRANTQRSLEGFAYTAGLVEMYLPEDLWRSEAAFYFRGQDPEELLRDALRSEGKIAAPSQAEGLDAALFSKLRVVAGDLAPLLAPDSRSIAVEVSLDDYGAVPNPENYPAVGEQVQVTYRQGDARREVFYTVCAWVDVPYGLTSRYYTMGWRVLLGTEALRRDAGAENVRPLFYLFDTPDAGAEAAAEAYLAALTGRADSPLMYESRATQRAHFQEFQMTFALLGGLLCGVIGVVGILNFFNAMMTAIFSRRREFAVLEAVGQTRRQLVSMLVWEGLFYTLGAGIIALALSAAVNPLAGRLMERAYWFYTYRYTIAPVLGMIPVFALLGAAIPALMYRQGARESVVERLREAAL